MSNVIGYKGTKDTRLENWLVMKDFKQSSKFLSNSNIQKLRDISIEDKNNYNRWLSDYVQAA